jgi:hypothetical protein
MMDGNLLLSTIKSDPLAYELLTRYHQAQLTNSTFRLSEPWMALAELRLLSLDIAVNPDGWDGLTDISQQGRQDCGRWMRSARPFLWRNDVYLVAQEMPLPEHIVSKPDAPFPLMWFSWECDAAVVGHNIDTVKGCFVDITDLSLNIVTVRTLEDAKKTQLMLDQIPYGTRWSHDSPGASGRGVILKLLAFLNSHCVVTTEHRAPRQVIRRAGRAGIPTRPADKLPVYVIQLRTPEGQKRTDSDAPPREFKHRFWVRGHIRAQWLPSLKQHKLIYIEPFIKGPAEAPFAQQVYDVCR